MVNFNTARGKVYKYQIGSNLEKLENVLDERDVETLKACLDAEATISLRNRNNGQKRDYMDELSRSPGKTLRIVANEVKKLFIETDITFNNQPCTTGAEFIANVPVSILMDINAHLTSEDYELELGKD